MIDDVFISKLSKLLNLTFSNQDNEALSAMRKANEAIQVKGLTWEAVLKGSQVLQSQPQQVQRKQEVTIPEMFETVFQTLTGSRATDFIQSLLRQYTDKGSLSSKQIEALKKFYMNALDRQNQ